VLNTVLQLVNDCDEEEWCQTLRQYLFWLDVCTLSVDVLGQRVMRRAAREALGFQTRPHAEQIGKSVLLKDGIDPNSVKAIFSELEPCLLENYKCLEMCKRTFPNAQLSYSFPYPGTSTTLAEVRKQSILSREISLKKLLK
jgi:hypothetical protein